MLYVNEKNKTQTFKSHSMCIPLQKENTRQQSIHLRYKQILRQRKRSSAVFDVANERSFAGVSAQMILQVRIAAELTITPINTEV
jgi:hypothetical protein